VDYLDIFNLGVQAGAVVSGAEIARDCRRLIVVADLTGVGQGELALVLYVDVASVGVDGVVGQFGL